MIPFETFAHLADIDLGAPSPKPTSVEGNQVEAAQTSWTSPDGSLEVGSHAPGRGTLLRQLVQ